MTVSIKSEQHGGYDYLLKILNQHPEIKYHFTPKKVWLVFETIADYDLWDYIQRSDKRGK